MEMLGPDVPLHFTAFHPDWKMMDKPATPVATLSRSRAIALKNGIRYSYTGNIHDFTGSSTYCHLCDNTLIGRDWYELSTWNIELENKRPVCKNCRTPIAGRFEIQPGTWGSRRQVVQFHD
jgi:pyruvate formate lyase activating enzyme